MQLQMLQQQLLAHSGMLPLNQHAAMAAAVAASPCSTPPGAATAGGLNGSANPNSVRNASSFSETRQIIISRMKIEISPLSSKIQLIYSGLTPLALAAPFLVSAVKLDRSVLVHMSLSLSVNWQYHFSAVPSSNDHYSSFFLATLRDPTLPLLYDTASYKLNSLYTLVPSLPAAYGIRSLP